MMNENNDSMSSEVPVKQERLDGVNSSIVNHQHNVSGCNSSGKYRNCETEELTILRTRLRRNEATAAEFHRIKMQIEEVLQNQAKEFELQMKRQRDAIVQLEGRLEEEQEVYMPESLIESDMKKIKCRLGEKIIDLLIDNKIAILPRPDDTSTLPKVQDNEPATVRKRIISEQKIKSEFGRIMKDGRVLEQSKSSSEIVPRKKKRCRLSRRGLIVEKVKQPLKVMQQKFTKLSSRTEDNESRINGMSSTASTDAIVSSQRPQNITGQRKSSRLEEQKLRFNTFFQKAFNDKILHSHNLDIMQKDCFIAQQKMSGRIKQENASIATIEENSPKEASEESGYQLLQDEFSLNSVKDESSSDKGRFEGAELHNRSITTGAYEVLPSHWQYFEIDWERHYSRCRRHFACNHCAYVSRLKRRIQDHIWIKHYNGHFKCSLDSSHILSWRSGVARHMKIMHSNVFDS